ncbi:MAG: MATE family efflux transporter [Eubacteriales bacterium]|nr:MATE family efflux transporter [Eubacteriales bacterium]
MVRDRSRLGEEKISALLREFAVPSIVAMIVNSLYNMVDQFFIGRSVGELGNAATNIQFPLSTACIAIALLCGIGGASAFNIAMGNSRFVKEEVEHAADFMGNAVTMMVSMGTLLLLITQLFLRPLLLAFGSPENVLGYAMTYTRIVSLGFPFLIMSSGGGSLIRADGRPKATMACNLTGALINTVLDAVFVMGFHWGMAGAAWATVIGQVIAGGLIIYYLRHAKTVTLQKKNFLPKAENIQRIASLGAAQCFNQIAMMIVQIVMNNSLKYYGARSSYGESIPIAVAGIISKVNMIYMAFVIGLSQGMQPIVSYNYGSRQYQRVKKAYFMTLLLGLGVSVIFFLLFQFQPQTIISIFGDGSSEYVNFAVRYFRIYLLMTFANFVQPISSNAYTAMGKPVKGMILSLTRQIIFLLPLLLLLPLFWGIDGILYAGPIADAMAVIACAVMSAFEFSKPQYKRPQEAE